MKTSLLLIGVISLLAGCAVQKDWVPTGGSRADGVVELSYDVGQFENPVLSESQGLEAAQESCSAWGFGEARPFGGTSTDCHSRNGYGNCINATVTKKYQCIE